MNLKEYKKIILKNISKKKFFISDGYELINGNEIIHRINKNANYLKKFKLKGKTIAIIKNKSGVFYWTNFITAFLSDFTIYPEVKSNNIKNLYNNIVVFDGKKILIKSNKSNKDLNIKKFDIIFSSSGSTGEPKLILQTKKSVLKNTQHVLKQIKFKKNKIFMMCIPYIYTSAICHFFACVMSGVSIYAFQNTIFPSDLKNNLIEKKVNYFGGPPLHSKWIVNFFNNKLLNFEKLISSGDFLDNSTIDKYLKKKLNFKFFYMYGISEVGGRFCINRLKNNKFKYSVGKPLGYMKIQNKEFQESEILINSKDLYYGYYTKSKFILQKNNLYNSGDVGILKKGNLFLSGRTSEIFKSSGVMIYPQLIRNELIKTKWFDEVFVFKGNISGFGNAPFCVFSSKKKIQTDKIISHLKKKIPSEQIPKKIIQIKNFPRLGNNKIDKFMVINTYNK